jgi:hypothetical protein
VLGRSATAKKNFWLIPRRLNVICRCFVTLCSILIGEHSAESSVCCLGVRYACRRDGFNFGLGCPCCLFYGSLYLLMAASFVLEDSSEKF